MTKRKVKSPKGYVPWWAPSEEREVILKVGKKSKTKKMPKGENPYWLKRKLFVEQAGKCHYCGRQCTFPEEKQSASLQSKDLFTVDELWPRKYGGKRSYMNSVGACRACNLAKGSMTLARFMERELYKEEFQKKLKRGIYYESKKKKEKPPVPPVAVDSFDAWLREKIKDIKEFTKKLIETNYGG